MKRDAFDEDEMRGGQPVHRVVPASVFEFASGKKLPIDPASIRVFEGLPMPTGQPQRWHRWDVLLNQLLPGIATDLIPNRYRGMVTSAVRRYHKRSNNRLSIRTVDPGHFRIWGISP